MEGVGKLAADSFVVNAGKVPRVGKPREDFRKSEYLQVAIQTICRGVPPRDVDRTQLYEDVLAWLEQDAGFRATGMGNPTRRTFVRTLQKLWRRP